MNGWTSRLRLVRQQICESSNLKDQVEILFLFCLFFKVVEDYPDQQLEAAARSLLNHGAKPVSPKV